MSTLAELLSGLKEGMAALGLEGASIKVPASLVEGKRPATFTPQASRNRLHFLQNLCSVPRDGSGQGLSAPEGILVIPGVDGHFNDGSQRIMNFIFNGKWYARWSSATRCLSPPAHLTSCSTFTQWLCTQRSRARRRAGGRSLAHSP